MSIEKIQCKYHLRFLKIGRKVATILKCKGLTLRKKNEIFKTREKVSIAKLAQKILLDFADICKKKLAKPAFFSLRPAAEQTLNQLI